MTVLSVVFVAGVALYVALAAVLDIRQQRVPNFLTVPAALAGIAFHTFMPGGWGLGVSLAGFAVGFSLLMLPWLFGGGGMGDVKLLAALGAWLGPKLMLVAFAMSVFTAAVLALGVLAWVIATEGFGRAQGAYLKTQTVAATGGGNAAQPAPRRKQRMLPFALPVALSVWTMLAWMVMQGRL
ncbi:MAG: A24 family peptidase [Planctomycetia bacterium]|nr:A24 family peptidase [Planctomycetia bacterium]